MTASSKWSLRKLKLRPNTWVVSVWPDSVKLLLMDSGRWLFWDLTVSPAQDDFFCVQYVLDWLIRLLKMMGAAELTVLACKRGRNQLLLLYFMMRKRDPWSVMSRHHGLPCDMISRTIETWLDMIVNQKMRHVSKRDKGAWRALYDDEISREAGHGGNQQRPMDHVNDGTWKLGHSEGH